MSYADFVGDRIKMYLYSHCYSYGSGRRVGTCKATIGAWSVEEEGSAAAFRDADEGTGIFAGIASLRFCARFDRGRKAARVAASVGVAAKTVRTVAQCYEENGLKSALYEKPRPGKQSLGRRPEPADHRHGVLAAPTWHSAVECAPDRRRSGKAKARAAGGPEDNLYPASEPRTEAVARKNVVRGRTR